MVDCKKLDMKMHGNVTMGPKGQIVIPKDVRTLIGISPGDNLVVITKGGMAIGMVKSDDMQKVIKYMQHEIEN